MHPKSPKWLEHVADHGRFILDATAGRSLADDERDRQLRLAVEQSFEILGEALLRLERTDPATAGPPGSWPGRCGGSSPASA